MKWHLKPISLSVILLISLAACQQNTREHHQTEAKTMSKDTYSPGPNWKLVWADEFDQPTIDTNNWNHQVLPAGNFNDEWQRYTNSSKNSYIEDSCLIITAIHESDQHGMDQYSSARLNTANNQAWTYGKVAARIKLPHGMGIWPAFWMLGANIDENGGDTPWPQCGEIDIMELFGFRSDAEVEANIHYADSSGQHAQMGAVGYHLKEGIFADDFHVFELEWTSEKMIWRVDGKAYVETPITDNERTEFHQDFFILLNVAVGGAFAGRPDKTTEFPQSMYVDWVRVYQEG